MLGFGCKVLCYDVYPSEEVASWPNVSYVPLDQSLAKMQRGVVLINTSRGGLVDTLALIEALKSGQVSAAGLDVYENEKSLFFEDHSSSIMEDDAFVRLLSFPNVIVTGHQAFLTEEALSKIAEVTLENVKQVMIEGKRGKEVENIVFDRPKILSGGRKTSRGVKFFPGVQPPRKMVTNDDDDNQSKGRGDSNKQPQSKKSKVQQPPPPTLAMKKSNPTTSASSSSNSLQSTSTTAASNSKPTSTSTSKSKSNATGVDGSVGSSSTTAVAADRIAQSESSTISRPKRKRSLPASLKDTNVAQTTTSSVSKGKGKQVQVQEQGREQEQEQQQQGDGDVREEEGMDNQGDEEDVAVSSALSEPPSKKQRTASKSTMAATTSASASSSSKKKKGSNSNTSAMSPMPTSAANPPSTSKAKSKPPLKSTGAGRLAKPGQAVGTSVRKSIYLDKDHVIESGLVRWFRPLLCRMLELWVRKFCSNNRNSGISFERGMVGEVAYQALMKQKVPLQFLKGWSLDGAASSNYTEEDLTNRLAYMILSKCLPFMSTYFHFFTDTDPLKPTDETTGVNCEPGWKPLHRPLKSFVLDVFPFAAKGSGEPTISQMCNEVDYLELQDERDKEAWAVCTQLQVCNSAFVTSLGLQMVFTDEFPPDRRIKAIIHAVSSNRFIRDREKLRMVKHMHVVKRLIMDRCVSISWFTNPHVPQSTRDKFSDLKAICREKTGGHAQNNGANGDDERAIDEAIDDLSRTHLELLARSQEKFSMFAWRPRTKGDTLKDGASSSGGGGGGGSKSGIRKGKRKRGGGGGDEDEVDGEDHINMYSDVESIDSVSMVGPYVDTGDNDEIPKWVTRSLQKAARNAIDKFQRLPLVDSESGGGPSGSGLGGCDPLLMAWRNLDENECRDAETARVMRVLSAVMDV
ncbi:hypothetical protein HDU76_004226 [Blyttiomyces sp. JEL0837]|nr:hypothetical protein HDU76_004226 [Blyttiomyces sp. JEL0837]